MKKHLFKLTLLTAILALTITLAGCANFLENRGEEIMRHIAVPFIRPPVERIAASDYDELVAVILDFIMDFSPGGLIQYHHYDGEDVNASVQRAIYELQNHHPVGAYVVANITAEETIIISYFEIDVEIEYKRTQEQLESIVTVSSRRYLTTQLLNAMSRYDEEVLIRTGMNLTEEDIIDLVREIYYNNPDRVVMLPVVAVDFYPEVGTDRIFEIKFGHRESPSLMQRYGEYLTAHIHDIAGRVTGETESEILLALVEFLIEAADFDLGRAGTIMAHGTQDFATTAFGVLDRGSAVGEGFAMAFKALSDELRIDNRIVLGHLDGMVHAWNIVSLYGEFYHIDVAMSSIYGLETAFLRTDEDFEEMYYEWDRYNTVRAEGNLTLDDIRIPEDPYYTEDEGEGEESGEESGEEDEDDG